MPPPTATVKAPFASERDWSAVEKNLGAEADEKKEGEAALNDEASARRFLRLMMFGRELKTKLATTAGSMYETCLPMCCQNW